MIMKRFILLTTMLVLAVVSMQAQVLIKHDGNEKMEFGVDKLVKMEFTTYDGDASNGDNILFVRQSGDTLIFDIDEIYAMEFAGDFTKIDAILESGEAAIVYDAVAHRAYAANVEASGTIYVFTGEGKPVKSAEGNSISVADLPEGIYIVSYNMELNAKIVKK